MSQIVIIGAGPIGLYLAYKLKKAGIALNNIVIYDPRAGEYSRPGHINRNIFALLEEALNKRFWPKEKTGHIKDVERILHAQITESKIKIEKKKFIRFSDNTTHPGVVIADEEGNEETIVCDYVFDCTGNQRIVVNKVNELVTPKPLTIKPISSQVEVKNHFLAFVKMSMTNVERINQSHLNQPSSELVSLFSLFNSHLPPEPSPLEYARTMEHLRSFGWNQFGLPNCYGMNFTKGKVCLYMECPDNLPQERYEAWVQAVINATTNSTDITFEQLPATKKPYRKPRFNSFTVDPLELEQVGHKADGLPLVVAVGDAQIEPNYVLAHGVKDGLKRVDKMIHEMIIINQSIAYFDEKEYHRAIAKQLDKHRQSIIKHYNKRSSYFYNKLEKARDEYTLAIQKVSGTTEAEQFISSLIEIKARLNYLNAETWLSQLHDHSGKISFTISSPENLKIQLVIIEDALMGALKDLPPSLPAEQKRTLEMLAEVAAGWKGLGTLLVQKKQYAQALEVYNAALLIYQTPLLTDQYQPEELILHSNSVICLRNMNKNADALIAAKQAIEKYPDAPNLLATKQKLMFNLLKALNDEFKTFIPEGESEQWSLFLDSHQNLLNKEAQNEKQKLFPDTKSSSDKENPPVPQFQGSYTVSQLILFKKPTCTNMVQRAYLPLPPEY